MGKGDIEKGFAEADHIFEDSYTSPPTQHAPMESYTTIARFERSGKLNIWTTCQNPFVVREQLGAIFHLPLSKVHLSVPHLGAVSAPSSIPSWSPWRQLCP